MNQYPWYTDVLFNEKILKRREIKRNALDFEHQPKRCLENYQYLVSNFINPLTPYNSLLLYFSVGTGKTTSAIAIAENFIRQEGRKVIVITKNTDLEKTFKKEILTVCSSYTNAEEVKLLNSGSDLEKSKIYGKLKNIYSFISHSKVRNIKNKIDFTGKVVIIDEVHNLLGNTGYEGLQRILQNSKDYKLILLSATPVYDNIKDAFQLSNVLNGFRTNQLPEDGSGYVERDRDVEKISIFNDGEMYKLSERGLDTLKKTLKGRVVYLKSNVKTFPSYSDEGEYISIGNYKSAVKVVKCKMSEFQAERYLKALSTNESKKDFNLILEGASSIVYPDYNGLLMIGKNGWNTYKNTTIYKEDRIEQHSTKLYNLLQNIKKSTGKVMIYSKYITGDGTDLIIKVLHANGFKGKYIFLTSEKLSDERFRAVERFNAPKNDDGSDIKIVILSSVASEGITFKCVREVHIYEPAWNFSGLDQVTGRAIRKNSHERLPLSDRNVKIFRYCAVAGDDISKSSDASKYIKAGRKDVNIKQFERMVAQSSFACVLNSSRNINVDGMNGSRECDYTDCVYTCETSGQSVETSDGYSTYLFNNELYKIILKDLIKLFEKIEIMSIDNIVDKLKYDKLDIQSVLAKVVKDGSPMKLVVKGKYYLKDSLIPRVDNKDKVVRLEDTYFVVNGINKLLRGEEIDGNFKIFVKSSTLGKVCTSFKKDELLNMFELLGKEKPRGTKEQLCSELKKILFP